MNSKITTLHCDYNYIIVPLAVCRAYKILDIQFSTISIWHVAFLALDQYAALKFPHFYINFASNKRPSSRGSLTYISVICIMWFVSMTISVSYILGFPDSVVANSFSNYSDLCHQSSYESRANLYHNNNSKIILLNVNRDYADIFIRYSTSPIHGFENLTIFNTLTDLSAIGFKYYLNATKFYVEKIIGMQGPNQCTFMPNLIITLVGAFVSFFIPLGAMLYFLFSIISGLRNKIQSMPKSNQTLIKGGVRFSGLVRVFFYPLYKFPKNIDNSFLAKTYGKTSIVNETKIFTISKSQVNNDSMVNIAISSIDNAIDASRNKPNCTNSRIFERERKAIYYILTILVLFMICWIPLFLYYFLLGIFQFQDPYWVGDLLNWAGYVNSAINPMFYFFMHRGVRARKLK
ncbi:unnamed protein product [Gordionus sp. m RMFG-2023]